MKNLKLLTPVLLALSIVSVSVEATAAAAIVADHNAVAAFPQVPGDVIEQIRSSYNVYYVHTSHGSQIMTGLSMLETEDASYDPPPFYEAGDDLGHVGDTSWVPATRVYLDNHPECNMAMFSWCGGASDNTVEGINIYLGKMEDLEATYPGVTFVYMTGHLDGGGVDGSLYTNNNQIRDYCVANEKLLFDFADIESWNPDGTYYPDESDGCAWCLSWCETHTCPTCGSCAHSHCFNCYLKGRAWWWMMARVSGWWPEECCGQYTGGYTGNCNCSADGLLTLSDITRLIDHVYVSKANLCCGENGNVNGSSDGKLTLSDITLLIDHIYISRDPTEPCP